MKTNEIKPDPKQPRKTFDVVEMGNIKSSIKQHGIIQPIIIDGDNHIIDGERRWRAAKELGLKEVPTIKLDSRGKRFAWQVVIDAQHQNIPIQERDKAWLRLYEELGRPTKVDFSKIVGKSEMTVHDALERAQYVNEVRPAVYKDSESMNRTRFIDDPDLRQRVIEKVEQIGTNTTKDQYLARVKKGIDEGKVEEVLNEDITDYVKRADTLLFYMGQIIKELKPGLMLKLPRTQALVVSQRIVLLREHLKKWDDNGSTIKDAEEV